MITENDINERLNDEANSLVLQYRIGIITIGEFIESIDDVITCYRMDVNVFTAQSIINQ